MDNGKLDEHNDVSKEKLETMDPAMHMPIEAIRDHDVNKQPLEIYMYYAAIERAREAGDTSVDDVSPWTNVWRQMTGRKPIQSGAAVERDSVSSEKNSGGVNKYGVTESESYNAYRALRTATWQGVFFLITTDILGPSSAPFAFSQLGYVGGILTYTILFVLAVLGGQILWRMYLHMDSVRYPVKCYADLGERTFGRAVRHIFNILQSLQLVLNVGLITLGSAQTLAAIIKYKFCFSIMNVLFMISGMILGQIKGLKKFAWFANLAVWLNLAVIILTVVGVPVFGPVPTLNFADFNPVTDTIHVVVGALAPAGNNWYLQMVGVQQAVFAYGGAMIFVEFMAEMKRPHDFWKGAVYAQTFIYLVYMFYGLFVYSFQGQYTYIISNLGIANQALLDVTNIIGLFSGMIAAVLYGNIGIKVIYVNVLQEYFHAPDLSLPRARFHWVVSVISYWAFAFVIASAIPNLASMATLVGAFCILQFTYTFPPILYLGYLMQKDAMVGEGAWEPGMAVGSNRIDSWRNLSRWRRGFRNQVPLKILLFILFLGACAFWGLGSYAGIKSLQVAFAEGKSVAFSCRAPGQPADTPTPP